MASIIARGNTFRIAVSDGKDKNGNQVKRSLTYKPKATTPAAIRKEVEQAAAEFEKKVREGRYLDGEHMTFIQLVQRWKENYALKNLGQHTLEEYEDTLKRQFYPYIGDMKVSNITALNLQLLRRLCTMDFIL